MTKVVKLKLAGKEKTPIQELLLKAMKEEYTGVMIIAIDDDDCLTVISEGLSRNEANFMLDSAKMHCLGVLGDHEVS